MEIKYLSIIRCYKKYLKKYQILLEIVIFYLDTKIFVVLDYVAECQLEDLDLKYTDLMIVEYSNKKINGLLNVKNGTKRG